MDPITGAIVNGISERKSRANGQAENRGGEERPRVSAVTVDDEPAAATEGVHTLTAVCRRQGAPYGGMNPTTPGVTDVM